MAFGNIPLLICKRVDGIGVGFLDELDGSSMKALMM